MINSANSTRMIRATPVTAGHAGGNMCRLCRQPDKVKQVEVGETLTFQRETFTVKDPCYKEPGDWICVEHNAFFFNSMQRDMHMFDRRANGKYTCKIAWKCEKHGIEKP